MSKNNDTLINISDLTVLFGKQRALDGVSFTIPKGAVGLLGPNGSGKSTLLKTLLGFLDPHQGSTTVLGFNSSTDGVKIRERVGYMSESDSIIPGLTGVEFVAYLGQVSGMPYDDALQRAHASLHYVGLGEARYRAIEEYSTGMRQRAKLAQALVHDPDLLFLDEPTNGMDPKGRQDMLDLVKDISDRLGISVLLSSHLLKDVEYVCDHVVILKDGVCLAESGIDNLKDSGENRLLVRLRADNLPEAVGRLAGQGLQLSPRKNGLYQLTLPEDMNQAAFIKLLKKEDVVLTGLQVEETTLEEIFISYVMPGNGNGGNGASAEKHHAGL